MSLGKDQGLGRPAPEFHIKKGHGYEVAAVCVDDPARGDDTACVVLRELVGDGEVLLVETNKTFPHRFLVREDNGEIEVIEALPPEPAPSPARAEESLGFSSEEIAQLDTIRSGGDLALPPLSPAQ